jgi:hypothetical protein
LLLLAMLLIWWNADERVWEKGDLIFWDQTFANREDWPIVFRQIINKPGLVVSFDEGEFVIGAADQCRQKGQSLIFGQSVGLGCPFIEFFYSGTTYWENPPIMFGSVWEQGVATVPWTLKATPRGITQFLLSGTWICVSGKNKFSWEIDIHGRCLSNVFCEKIYGYPCVSIGIPSEIAVGRQVNRKPRALVGDIYVPSCIGRLTGGISCDVPIIGGFFRNDDATDNSKQGEETKRCPYSCDPVQALGGPKLSRPEIAFGALVLFLATMYFSNKGLERRPFGTQHVGCWLLSVIAVSLFAVSVLPIILRAIWPMI